MPTNSRSAGVSFGRFTERCRTPIWWRSARISSWRATRLRNEAASAAMSAVIRWPSGNRRISDKLQFINLIGIYGKHNLDRTLFWTTADLEAKLFDFQNYYNTHQTHAGLDGRLPEPTDDGSAPPLDI